MKQSQRMERKQHQICDTLALLSKQVEGEERLFNADEQAAWNAGLQRVDTLNNEWRDQVRLEAEVEARTMNGLNSLGDGDTTDVFGPNGDGKPGYVDQTERFARMAGGRVNLIQPKLSGYTNHRDAYDDGLLMKSILLSHSPRHDEAMKAREKYVSRRGEGWFASQNETTPTDGGYLVTPSFDNAVQVYREQIGASRRLARVVQVGKSDTWTGFKQTSGTTVYYVGEESAITPSDADVSRYTLSMKKRAILAYVSSELNEDAMPSVMDMLARDMGHQFALKEDLEFVAGDGTSTYGGVRGVRPAVIATGTAGVFTPTDDHDAWAEVTLSDFYGAMSLVADKYRGLPCSWLISGPAKWQTMDRLSLAANGTIPSDIVNGIPQYSFLGYPVVLSDRMPTTEAVSQVFALFGAFGDAVVLGERRGVRIAISEHFKFDEDKIAVRGTTRYDINCHECGNVSTAGAVVGVATHA
jgi:HK97 family phage major capsid protein